MRHVNVTIDYTCISNELDANNGSKNKVDRGNGVIKLRENTCFIDSGM